MAEAAAVAQCILRITCSYAVKHPLTETRQALEKTFTVIFEILSELRECVPVLDGDVIMTNSFGELFMLDVKLFTQLF